MSPGPGEASAATPFSAHKNPMPVRRRQRIASGRAAGRKNELHNCAVIAIKTGMIRRPALLPARALRIVCEDLDLQRFPTRYFSGSRV